MLPLESSYQKNVRGRKQKQAKQRSREKFNEWADKVESTLAKGENDHGLGSQCKMLIDWGRKLKSRDPVYYCQKISRFERLLMESVEILDSDCLRNLKRVSKHGLETAVRKEKIVSVVFSMIHYLIPVAGAISVRGSRLTSISLMKKRLTEMLHQTGKFDDEQIEAILRFIHEASEIGVRFPKILVKGFRNEFIGRMASRQIQHALDKGESQTVEFKSRFPQNATDLARTIASFATSDGGWVFLGVDNDGTISGLDIQDLSMDALSNRISDLAYQSIDPPVEVNIKFWEFQSRMFAVIEVSKGPEPVYFVNGIPYVRILTSSRRAKAHQVKELHRSYFERSKAALLSPP